MLQVTIPHFAHQFLSTFLAWVFSKEALRPRYGSFSDFGIRKTKKASHTGTASSSEGSLKIEEEKALIVYALYISILFLVYFRALNTSTRITPLNNFFQILSARFLPKKALRTRFCCYSVPPSILNSPVAPSLIVLRLRLLWHCVAYTAATGHHTPYPKPHGSNHCILFNISEQDSDYRMAGANPPAAGVVKKKTPMFYQRRQQHQSQRDHEDHLGTFLLLSVPVYGAFRLTFFFFCFLWRKAFFLIGGMECLLVEMDIGERWISGD